MSSHMWFKNQVKKNWGYSNLVHCQSGVMGVWEIQDRIVTNQGGVALTL
jgi:hypothetical protein